MFAWRHICNLYVVLLIGARCEQASRKSNSVAASEISSLEKDGDCSAFLQNKVHVLDPSFSEEQSSNWEHHCLHLLQRAAGQCRAEHIPFSITDHAAPFKFDPRPEYDDEASSLINHSFPGLVVLNEEHHIYAVEGFLSQDERVSLVASASRDAEHKSLGLLQQQTSESQSCEHLIHAVDKDDSSSSCSNFHYRHSYQSCAQNKTMLDLLNRKVDSLLPGLQSHIREPLVITRYPTGGFYSEHFDGRRATVLVHLSEEDAFTGGATFFRQVGLRVHGKPGLALVFFPNFGKVCNDPPDGPCSEQKNGNLAHMAEEVESGEKLIGQIWIGMEGMDTCKGD